MEIHHLPTQIHIPVVSPMQNKPTTVDSTGETSVQNVAPSKDPHRSTEMLEQCGFATPEKWVWFTIPIWLVVLTCFNHIEKYMSSSMGRIIPYIMENVWKIKNV